MPAYTLTLTDGSTLTQVLDRQNDTTTTSLTLFGYGSLTWPVDLQNNLLHLMENFCSSTPPEAPLTGQMWFDNALSEINVYDSNGWEGLATRTWVMANFAQGADYGGYGVTPQLTFTGDVYGTGSGSITLTLSTSGVAPGVYTKVIVDDRGRVISGGEISATDVLNACSYMPVRSINANFPNADGDVSLDVNFTESVNGLYPSATGNIVLNVGVLTINGLEPDSIGNLEIAFSGDVISTETGFNLTLAPSGADPGIYTKVSVDSKGRVVSGLPLVSSDVQTALGFQPVSTVNGVSPDSNGNVVIEVASSTSSQFQLTTGVLASAIASLPTVAGADDYLWNDGGMIAINGNAPVPAPINAGEGSVTLDADSSTSDVVSAIGYLLSTLPTTVPGSAGALWNDNGLLALS